MTHYTIIQCEDILINRAANFAGHCVRYFNLGRNSLAAHSASKLMEQFYHVSGIIALLELNSLKRARAI